MYQYSEALVEALAADAASKVEVVALVRHSDADAAEVLRTRGIGVMPLLPPRRRMEQVARSLLKRTKLVEPLQTVRRRFWGRELQVPLRPRPDVREHLCQLGVDLLLFPAPDTLSFEAGLPSIMAIHDLQHRLQPEFHEVIADGEFEVREYLYGNAVRHCMMLLVDSEVGKEDVLELYTDRGATEDRIRVLPFAPAPYLRPDVSAEEAADVRRRHRLPERYLFYPAQFWPHKNHARIVRALAAPENRDVVVVFTGGNSGRFIADTFRDLMREAADLGVTDRVRYLGYVSNEDMSALYAGATALVMPTFFGPTNIPVIEAWNFGLPVITSDIRGIREQVGEAGLLVDPRSVDAISDAVHRVWTDEATRAVLSEAGRRRLSRYTADDYCERLKGILEEAAALVREEPGRAGG